MRIALAIAAVLALGAAGAYAAFGRGDELGGLKIPEVATESGRAHHFDVRALRRGLQPPDLGRRRARRRRAVGARAAGPRAAPRRRPPHRRARPLRPREARRRAGPARHRLPPRLRHRPPPLPALVGPEGRHARGRVPRAAATGRSSPSRCASCCSSTSPRRTTTAASCCSAPTAGSTSASATAAARSTRAATAQDPGEPARQDPRRRRARASARAGTSC